MARRFITGKVAGFSLRGAQGVIIVVALIAVAFALGGLLGGDDDGPTGESSVEEHDHAESARTVWTCSMHPQIQLPKPGQCPICAMDLIPLEITVSEDVGPRQLRMSEASKALARIHTTPAIRAFAEKEVRMYGRIAYDESRVAYITAWVPGRLDRLYADYTGITVKRGDHLVDMYSPELLASQEELIQARAAVKALRASPSEVLRFTARATVDAAREKLRLYGLTPAQIRRVEETGETTDHHTIYAPSGGVVVHKNALEGMYVETGTRIYTIADLDKLWVLFEAYESDLPWIHYGQSVEFSSESFPGQTFKAVISFVDPVVDPKTRTVRVRAVVDNTAGSLKPDMFVRGVLKSRLDNEGHIIDLELAGRWICPMHPEIVEKTRGDCEICGMDLVSATSLGYVHDESVGGDAPILIPSSAPLITGRRAVVYVEVENNDGPLFEGRVVELGPRAGDYYIVRSGIEEGEHVVTHGAFKIDSELQIQAKPSMMSPEGGVAPVHHHGGTPAGGAPAKPAEPVGDGTPGAQAKPQAADPHAAETNEPEKESAAVRNALANVYEAYFGVQMALADDDLDTVRKSAISLAAAVGRVDMSLFSSSGHVRWMKLSGVMTAQSQRIADTSNIKDARDAFYTLSNATIDMERGLGHAGGKTHYLKYCPMARDGDGAYWLQSVETTFNSYYGEKMLRCGSVKDTFASIGAEGEPSHDAH